MRLLLTLWAWYCLGLAGLDHARAQDAVPSPLAGYPNFSVVTYNAKGNGSTDWSTNSAQVRAIGRQLAFLLPDVIAFNEIPNNQWYLMTNFVAAYLPGYFLAVSPGTDGYIRNAVASRWPLLASRSLLAGSDLNPFGYNGRFTRDLFQAQLAVTNFPQPLNIFVGHFKATTSTPVDDALKRGAEARSVSNFLVTAFLKTNALQPYLLCGDLNEDVLRPETNRYTSALPIQTLVSAPTGLRLTTPINPYTRQDFTLSIRTTLNVRFDYALPCALLSSNVIASQVFRTDLLTNRPATLLAGDSATGSDHLPVMLVFSHPYAQPFRLLSLAHDAARTHLEWESIPGQYYRVESSADLAQWSILQNRHLASTYRTAWETNLPAEAAFFRVLVDP